jgi:hypothetical protein
MLHYTEWPITPPMYPSSLNKIIEVHLVTRLTKTNIDSHQMVSSLNAWLIFCLVCFHISWWSSNNALWCNRNYLSYLFNLLASLMKVMLYYMLETMTSSSFRTRQNQMDFSLSTNKNKGNYVKVNSNKLDKQWSLLGVPDWYVSNVSIIFDAPCLFLHHLPIVSLHLVALLYIFRN